MAPTSTSLSAGTPETNASKQAKNLPYIPNPVKEALARNELTYAFTVKLLRSIEAVQIAQTAGYNSILIDLEHAPLTLEQTGQMCLAALARDMCPIVRIPQLERHWISRTLDIGALGILVPHIKTVEEVRRVVSYSRFQPIGERSAVAGLPHLRYKSYPVAEANKACNEATLVIVMIETLEALEIVEEIAQVPGVDQLLIGTNDLTAEMGIPGQYDNPRLTEAYQRVINAAQANGLSVGIGGLASRSDLVAKFARMGARFVMAATDQPLLSAAAAKNAAEMKQLGESLTL
ncbi:hypothetical protein EX895_005786 [Sporisorium graminicola]|uniref:HpcH/HpaI aldolase/citrate lyase domain-containing protein n=1 Tax=Sporisorium graminicola TaxID=280036 RepID=A0A4U7KLM0_9BASI|nr:hypothetical protein EX895_005786 [Sporisorium graminicola]TKY84706.1 hypothetical protein EX895_005786 [Sporisorium graminicola]